MIASDSYVLNMDGHSGNGVVEHYVCVTCSNGHVRAAMCFKRPDFVPVRSGQIRFLCVCRRDWSYEFAFSCSVRQDIHLSALSSVPWYVSRTLFPLHVMHIVASPLPLQEMQDSNSKPPPLHTGVASDVTVIIRVSLEERRCGCVTDKMYHPSSFLFRSFHPQQLCSLPSETSIRSTRGRGRTFQQCRLPKLQ